jgi:hypothetical protein
MDVLPFSRTQQPVFIAFCLVYPPPCIVCRVPMPVGRRSVLEFLLFFYDIISWRCTKGTWTRKIHSLGRTLTSRERDPRAQRRRTQYTTYRGTGYSK